MTIVMRPIHLCLLLLLASLPGTVVAVACGDVFSNVVGTSGGKLKLDDKVQLSNTGDRILATGDLDAKDTPCDGQPCVQNGTPVPLLALPPNGSNTDHAGGDLALAPGDHYFDKFELTKNDRLTLTGSGQVRIHVNGDLKIDGNVRVNDGGSALDLVFLVGGKVEIKGNSRVTAMIYALDDIKVDDNARIDGALVGENADIKDKSRVTYVAPTGTAIPGFCEAGSGPAVLDHLRMLHDGFGIPGNGENVTIRACRTFDCSQLYTDSVTVDLLPVDASTSWSGAGVSGNQVTFTGGSHTVTLNRAAPGSVVIGLASTPTPVNPVRCFNGASETCTLTFVSPAFDVVVPDQVSGVTSNGTVSLSDCWSDFQSTTQPVSIAARYISPSWVGPAVTVNGSALPIDGSAVAIDLGFDASCSAPLTVAYDDAGEIAVDVTFTGTGSLAGLTIVGSASPVFYPNALVVQAVNGSGAVLDAASAGALPTHAAADPFTLGVSAVNINGDVTAGYLPQAADSLQVYVERSGPVSGFEGTFSPAPGTTVLTSLNPPTGPGDYRAAGMLGGFFSAGVFSHAAASYSEVGLVTLYLRDADYMGHSLSATPLAIGRFVPARFTASGTLTNRVATAGCSGDSFSYFDETLRVSAQLTAVNATGGVTRNYQDSFSAFTGTGFTPYGGGGPNSVGITAGAADLSSRLDLQAIAVPGGWSAGVATLDIDLAFDRAGSVDGPFDAGRIGIMFADGDGVPLSGGDLDVDGDSADDHVLLGTTNLRYGRVAFGNVHGSELRDLDVPLAMQYFAGGASGFVVHADDNCTAVGAVTLGDADTSDSLVLADTCIVDTPAASGSHACAPGTPGNEFRGTALGGRYVVSLKAPGAAKTGGIDITTVAPDWAKFDWGGAGDTDPVGLATFGIYNRNTGIIYQREMR